jgi:hypothetical protein
MIRSQAHSCRQAEAFGCRLPQSADRKPSQRRFWKGLKVGGSPDNAAEADRLLEGEDRPLRDGLPR